MPLGIRVDVDTSPIETGLTALQSRAASLKAVRSGVRIVSKGAKAMAPKRTGALRVAQGTKAKRSRKVKTGAYALQGAKTNYVRRKKGKRQVKPAKYDHLVIGGVKPHSIRKGSRVARYKKGKFYPAVGQNVGKPHPGARANPYRYRVWNAVKGTVAREMMVVMGVEVRKLLAKMHAKNLAKLGGR